MVSRSELGPGTGVGCADRYSLGRAGRELCQRTRDERRGAVHAGQLVQGAADGDGAGVRGGNPGRVRLQVVVLALALSLGLDASLVGGDLVVDAFLVPSQCGRHQLGDRSCAGGATVWSLDRDPRAPRENGGS